MMSQHPGRVGDECGCRWRGREWGQEQGVIDCVHSAMAASVTGNASIFQPDVNMPWRGAGALGLRGSADTEILLQVTLHCLHRRPRVVERAVGGKGTPGTRAGQSRFSAQVTHHEPRGVSVSTVCLYLLKNTPCSHTSTSC